MKARTVREVARALRVARSRLGLTQEELAEDAGTAGGPCAISHWEAGRRVPSLENFARLCASLDISPTEVLLTKED